MEAVCEHPIIKLVLRLFWQKIEKNLLKNRSIRKLPIAKMDKG